jgi:hypothetical protein
VQHPLHSDQLAKVHISKGYLYPILYPKMAKKDFSYHFLEGDIFLGIKYPNFRDFKVLYPILSNAYMYVLFWDFFDNLAIALAI